MSFNNSKIVFDALGLISSKKFHKLESEGRNSAIYMNGSGYGAWPIQKMNLNIMEPLAEHDGFEPQTRARSNTWPLPRPDNYVEPGEENSVVTPANAVVGNKCLPVAVPAVPAKKNSSRRNAWGNLSYADLITQAINTSPDKRLTLSQIYEWMVQNVPYFKDKGDSNSSAGWKVSALSLDKFTFVSFLILP